MSRKIIAVDFDGTLFVDAWPYVGAPIWSTIEKVKAEQADGAAIILWTCRSGEALTRAVDACWQVGLKVDAVNENLPELIKAWDGEDTRKVFATEYWDDRAVNMKSPWIPVTERLPKPFVSVLVHMPGEDPLPTVHEGFLTQDGRWYSNHFDRDPSEVTHWMPMPEVRHE